MALFGYLNKTEVSNLISKTLNATKKSSNGIVNAIEVEQLDRAKADVAKWRDALDFWEDVKTPDRFDMMQLYQEIINDDSVATHLNTILRRITGTEYEVGKLNDKGTIEPNVELMATLKGKWFDKIQQYTIESEMMGFTLVELSQPLEEKYTQENVSLIPRELVIPEKGLVRKKAQQNGDAIDYKAPAFLPRLLQLGDTYEKGLFNNIALLYIYKKNALAYWTNFQSKYGIPPVVVKTDLSNQKNVDTMTDFLKNMRNNTFAMVGYDDSVEPLNMNGADAYQTFKELIKMCDDAIAKVLEGQTMTSSDGSSRSQAEVHENTSNDWHVGRLRMIENYVNEQLMPILISDGKAKEGDVFRFKEIKNVDAIIDRFVKLKQAGFTVDATEASKLTGYTLTTAEATQPAQAPQNLLKAIDNLYNEIADDNAN